MIGHTRFRINSPYIIHETIDLETVIVNLDTGNYYSLDKIGVEIWTSIEKHIPLHEIIEDISRRYEGNGTLIEQAVIQLVNELNQENLIINDNSETSETNSGFDYREISGALTKKMSFEAPILHKYNDMQELLLIDPIHEVEETGWPNVKQDNK
jgi:hypothetical protein